FHSSLHTSYLHSFPTRRSSDLLYPFNVCHLITSLSLYFSSVSFKQRLLFFGWFFLWLIVLDHLIECFHYVLIIRFIDVRYFVSRSEEHTSELQSRFDLVCRLLL